MQFVFCLSSVVERSWDETENVCTLDFTTPVCCTNLNFSIFCRAQRYKPVIKEWLEQKRVARSCNYMDHHHAWFPRPTALHTLLPGVSFISQHISGMSLNIINIQQWTGCSCFTSCPVWIFGHLNNFQKPQRAAIIAEGGIIGLKIKRNPSERK